MFNSFAIAIAVSFASPVIMMTLTPAVRQSLIEALTSSRGGSLMHTKPTNWQSDSSSTYLSGFESSSYTFFEVMCFILPPSLAIAIPKIR